jgi:hypothetical protein
MDDWWVWLPALLAFLFVGERLIVTHDPGGVARMVGMVTAWLVLSVIAMALVHSVVFVAAHALLFSAGRELTVLAMIASALVLAATPVVCAVALRRGVRWLLADQR